ncbi:MAG: PHP-associated domain-containing protein [Candidatus Brocadiia bacterium]
MRVDLHLHTQENSDGRAPAADMIRAGIQHGLDGVVITDHHYMLTRDEQAALQAQFPGFPIFRGAEVSVGVEHVLVIGGSAEEVPAVEPGTVAELGEYARDTGAFTALAHPFWRESEFAFDLDTFCPEGMDVASMNIDTGRFDRIVRITRARSMLPVAGTDAHGPEEVGLFHIVLDERVETEEDLLAVIREGRYAVGTFEDLHAARCEEVKRNEDLARRILARGGGEEDYLAAGGHPAFFKRMARQGSHMPREEAIGMRPEDLGLTPPLRRPVRRRGGDNADSSPG